MSLDDKQLIGQTFADVLDSGKNELDHNYLINQIKRQSWITGPLATLNMSRHEST